jgi:hypothetical protein
MALNKEHDMRQHFTEAKTRREAARAYPWYVRIVKVDGGYMVFESEADYQTWRRQK